MKFSSSFSTWIVLKPGDPQRMQKLRFGYPTAGEILQVSFLSKEEAQINDKNI